MEPQKTTETGTPDLDTNALFTQYVDIVNRALGAHRKDTPWKQLFGAGEKLVGNKRIGAAVYKTNPKEPHDFFTLTLEGGTFHAQHGKADVDITWRVKEDHLRHVVKNPKPFIDNPARLDLDWLKTRLGV